MPLEVATFIDQLDGTNPPQTDLKAQGDDHLRLIKNVLKNSIKRVTRAFYVPNTFVVSGNITADATYDNLMAVYNTGGGACTLTLPSLSAADAGWCMYVQKTSGDANPVFIAPPSGTINGFTKVRRSVEFTITKIVWTGVNWVASRPHGIPIGACLEFHGTVLPNGCLWPDGTTFTAANYVELNVALGGNTKPDRGGRIAVCRDNIGGVDKNRVTSAGSGIDGDTVGASGGAQNVTLDATMIPAHTHTASVTDPGHTHQLPYDSSLSGPVGGGSIPRSGFTHADVSDSRVTGISVTNSSTGGGLSHQNMPPSLITNFVLIAE